jgi:hypothetical protein
VRQGHDAGHVNDFANNLRLARPYSLNVFLETFPKFNQVGKAAIANLLLLADGRSRIATAVPNEDWYRYLFSKFLVKRDQNYFLEQVDKLCVVTFNFDG